MIESYWLSKHAQWDSMVHVTVITITCCSGGCMYINGSICVAHLGSMYLVGFMGSNNYRYLCNNYKTEQQVYMLYKITLIVK